MKEVFRVAIDGPSGAGKSTIAKALAKELNIPVTELLGMESEAALPTEDRRFLEPLHQLDKFDRNTVWQIMDRLLFQQDSKEKARLRRAYMPLCRCEEAAAAGVEVLAMDCHVTETSMVIRNPVVIRQFAQQGDTAVQRQRIA